MRPEDDETPTPAPVLLLGFNRPDLLERNLEVIRSTAPRPVLVSLDGPRTDRSDDAARCAEARAVAEAVDWAPDVRLRLRERNLGCGPAVSDGISWAFSQFERLIILEDDCRPDASFFRFCDELLERYAEDERVMQIGGCNWGASHDRFGTASYAFTSFAPVWGWASWRRAWELYDYELATWPRFRDSGLVDGLPISRRFRGMMRYEWDRVLAGEGTWDHQWQYAVMRHHGLNVCPSRNLVVNVGFREDATHIGAQDYIFSRFPHETMVFPLRHPPEVTRDPNVEALFETIYHKKLGRPIRLYRKVVRSERARAVIRRVGQAVRRRPS